MFDRADGTFAGMLDAQLNRVLHGNDMEPGLIRSVLSVQTWDELNRARGEIKAYEAVRDMMREIARQMNGEDYELKRYERSMN